MKQILFLTAYSTHSKVAFRYAQKLAQYFGAGITLAHIYENPNPLRATDPGSLKQGEVQKDLDEILWENQLEKLKAFAAEMEAEEYDGIPLDFIVTDGEVVDELLMIEKQNDFDLVVMGMRKHGIAEQLFGNTTYRIISEIDSSILLIPPGVHFMGIDKIIYGTAFELGDTKAIDFLLDWCLAFSATLEILHVHQLISKEEAVEKMNDLVEDFQEGVEVGVISLRLLEGKIAEVIEKEVDFVAADILAIHHRKKGFWERIREGSLSKILAESVDVPLLILK